MAWPRWNAMPRTSSGLLVCASTRGDGWLPIRPARRDTRPPSSSTLTASGSGLADAAMSANGAPIIDRSVQLPIMMPPTWWLSTTARASSAPVTPTISSWASLSLGDIAASTSPQAGGAGAAGTGGFGEVLDGPAAGLSVAVEQASRRPVIAARTPSRRDRAMTSCCHGALSCPHGPRVSLAAWTGFWCPLQQASLSAYCWARPPSSESR